jgi:dihydroflavonol-4-reductase
MRAFVTGGSGFIGQALVRALVARGDAVRALVRSRSRAESLAELGCEVVEGDLLSEADLASAIEGCDAAFHLAGVYRVGISAEERPAMLLANVTATERVLDAAHAAGVTRTVHVSTINAFGNTGYRVVDETFERPRPYRYVSFYDETKHLAHLAAQRRIEAGSRIVIAQPGGVYGPGDHSEIGGVLRQAAEGRLPAITFGELGMNMVHVEDVAAGIVLAHDRGAIGQSYVLGGEILTMAELVRRVSAIVGRRAPRLSTPTWLLRGVAPLAGLAGRNVGELISASAGVTYWATDAKARRELGYAPRDLEAGLAQVFG